VGGARPRTDSEWAEAFESSRRKLAARDAEFAAAARAYRRAVDDAQAQCGPGDPKLGELWAQFPAVAKAWDRCAALAEPLLGAACGEDGR